MNIILDGLPKTVNVDGMAFEINTYFRVCLKILRAFEDERLTELYNQIMALPTDKED